MNVEELLILEPSDIDFKSLPILLLHELTVAETFGDSRIPNSALFEMSSRAFEDRGAKDETVRAAKALLGLRGRGAHAYAYAYSVLYLHSREDAVELLPRIVADCSSVVLIDIADCFSPDLEVLSNDPAFRRAADLIASRIAKEKHSRIEYVEFLKGYERM